MFVHIFVKLNNILIIKISPFIKSAYNAYKSAYNAYNAYNAYALYALLIKKPIDNLDAGLKYVFKKISNCLS